MTQAQALAENLDIAFDEYLSILTDRLANSPAYSLATLIEEEYVQMLTDAFKDSQDSSDVNRSSIARVNSPVNKGNPATGAFFWK